MINEKMYELGSKRSCIRDLFEYGLKQAAAVGRENVYDYSIGNPSIPAPHEVGEAFNSILRERDSLAVHGYTPAPGCMEARTAIADEISRRYGTTANPADIFLSCGAAPALISVIRALAVEDAEIMVVAPYFPEYRPFIENNGAKFVEVPADTDGFQIQRDKLEALITAHTQAVIINSPNNPSGVIYTEQTLTTLGEMLTKKSKEYGHPIYIIADEPYRELAYDNTQVPFVPCIYKNTVVCYSYSKSLSLPGERIGYVYVPQQAEDGRELFDAIAGAARSIGHVCAPSLQQLVVARCVSVPPDLAAYDRNRATLYEALSSYGYECVKPTGAFYMFVKAPTGDAQAFSDEAKKLNLLVVPGGDFGCPEYFRICTCVDHDMIIRSLPAFKAMIKK